MSFLLRRSGMLGPAEPPGNVGPVLLDPRACQACVGPGRRTCIFFKRAWVRAIGPDLSSSVRGPEPSDPQCLSSRQPAARPAAFPPALAPRASSTRAGWRSPPDSDRPATRSPPGSLAYAPSSFCSQVAMGPRQGRPQAMGGCCSLLHPLKDKSGPMAVGPMARAHARLKTSQVRWLGPTHA
jgi:hypothetical protein